MGVKRIPRDPVPDVVRRLAREPSAQERAVHALQQARVPLSAIVRLPREVENTAEELQRFFEWAQTNKARCVILVTSPYHTRRIRLIWNWRYQRFTPALVYPTSYEHYDPHRWWRSRLSLERSVHELVGIINLFVGISLPTYDRQL